MGREKSDSASGVSAAPADIPIAGQDYELQLPKAYLSFTQIDMYIRCPQQYQFRYIEGRKEPPAIALVEGGAHHTALETNHNHKLEHTSSLTNSDLVDCFVAAFDERQKEIANWDGMTRDTIIGRGEKMLVNYNEQVAPKVVPVAVEEKVGLEVAGIPVLEYIDVRTARRFLDFKTCNKHRSQNDVDGSLQMMLYALGVRKSEGMIVELNKKSTQTRVHLAKYPPGLVGYHVARIVSRVAAAISHGDFPPTAPNHWACSEKWCGFFHSCRGAATPPPPKLFRRIDIQTDPKSARGGK